MKNREQSKVSHTANDDVSLIIIFSTNSYCDVLIFLKNVKTNFIYSMVLTNDGLV